MDDYLICSFIVNIESLSQTVEFCHTQFISFNYVSFNHNLDLEKPSKYYTFKCTEQRKTLQWKLHIELFKI